MSISLRQALRLAVGPANVDAAGHAVADWFDGHNCSGAAELIREALRDQLGQPASDAVPHNRPDTSLRAELLGKLDTQREVILSLCDRVDRLEMRADGLTPIERVQRRWAKERSVKESLTVGGNGPAVPDGREPASVVEEPSDRDLRQLYADTFDLRSDPASLGPAIVKFARAVLARWGRQPAPPVEGEVGELVADELVRRLRTKAATEKSNRCHYSAILLTRAADILEQRHPAPVPGPSHFYFEFVISDADDCTQAGGIAPTYAKALSGGQHYLAQCQQDGPHTLELRRVEVLHPDALPEQRQAAPVPVAERLPVDVEQALIKAECALSDIAEGEPEGNDGDSDALLQWAEQRAATALSRIRPVMRLHGIHTSEWPPLPATALPLPLPQQETPND